MKAKDVEKALSVAPSKEDIAALRQLAGEVERSQISIKRIAVDYRSKIDGQKNENFGGFCIVDSQKNADGSYTKNMEPLGKSFEAVILRRRNMAKCYDAVAEKTIAFTHEFDSFTAPLEVFNADKQSMGFDFYKNQKAKHGLKPSMILYLWFRDDIYRLTLSASSMFSFGDYEQQFRESHVSLVTTSIGTKEEQKSDSSPVYFLATFNQTGTFPYEHAKELIGGLNEALKLYEQARDGKDKNVDPTQTSRGSDDYVDQEDYSKEKIDVSGLPF